MPCLELELVSFSWLLVIRFSFVFCSMTKLPFYSRERSYIYACIAVSCSVALTDMGVMMNSER